MFDKLKAAYLDRPHVLAVLAWAAWLIDVLITWASSGEPLNAQTLGVAIAAALFTKRPGDLTKGQAEEKADAARMAGAAGARISSVPPRFSGVPEFGELEDEVTPADSPHAGKRL